MPSEATLCKQRLKLDPQGMDGSSVFPSVHVTTNKSLLFPICSGNWKLKFFQLYYLRNKVYSENQARKPCCVKKQNKNIKDLETESCTHAMLYKILPESGACPRWDRQTSADHTKSIQHGPWKDPPVLSPDEQITATLLYMHFPFL